MRRPLPGSCACFRSLSIALLSSCLALLGCFGAEAAHPTVEAHLAPLEQYVDERCACDPDPEACLERRLEGLRCMRDAATSWAAEDESYADTISCFVPSSRLGEVLDCYAAHPECTEEREDCDWRRGSGYICTDRVGPIPTARTNTSKPATACRRCMECCVKTDGERWACVGR